MHLLQLRGFQRPKKLTFIEQANKRQCCLKIISFIKFVDFLLRYSLQQVVYNSVKAISLALTERSKKDLNDDSQDDSSRNLSKKSHQKGGKLEDREQIVPVFSLTVGVQAGIFIILI